MDAAEEAVAETLRCLSRAQRPFIVAGVEIHRFGLPDDPLRSSRMVSFLNDRIDDRTIVLADVGDSLGAATERAETRIVVLVGDGAIQMTGQGLSSLIRDGHCPIVIVLDNHGYATERYLHEGDWDYNEIHPWEHTKLVEDDASDRRRKLAIAKVRYR